MAFFSLSAYCFSKKKAVGLSPPTAHLCPAKIHHLFTFESPISSKASLASLSLTVSLPRASTLYAMIVSLQTRSLNLCSLRQLSQAPNIPYPRKKHLDSARAWEKSTSPGRELANVFQCSQMRFNPSIHPSCFRSSKFTLKKRE
eukprot:TRINITY_DN22501_c0_g1_i1.p1 TRINITY_DN22501_c0_g1~~TRINITY_DN22501_c0_g1_i1.p1  ORF type:complete len:144 (+),score=8.74 TRINITY_DN22501_c0_g1_i1:171-602(+)